MSNKTVHFDDTVDVKKEKTTGTPLPQYFYCEVCKKSVHLNDKRNHLDGNKHNFRHRRQHSFENPQKQEAQDMQKFKCEICKTKFTDEGFYKVHKGSKTHKRNLRRLQRLLETSYKIPEGSSATTIRPQVHPFAKPQGRRMTPKEDLNVEEIADIPEYVYRREKYRPRNMKTEENHYKSYIHSVTAYWALSLAVNPNVVDFKIAVNDKEWKSFGDVIIELQFITGEQTTYVIQFKQVSNNVKHIDSLTEGKFNFEKLVVQLAELSVVQNLKSVKFVIFTTATPTSNFEKSVTLKPSLFKSNSNKVPAKDVVINIRALSNKKKDPVNTLDDNENIYFFTAEKDWDLPKIYLYSRQKKIKGYETAIDSIILEKLNKSKQIHRDFIKYIANWSEGFLGGNYKLQKEDIGVKLGDLLLSEHRKQPETFMSSNKEEDFHLWDTAVNSFDVTILKKNPAIIAKVCKPSNAKIEKRLGVKTDTSTNSVNVTQKVVGNIENPVLKMFLFEEKCMNQEDDDLPLDLIYLIFWKAGLIPMILTADNSDSQDYILCVIELVKGLNAKRNYFLRTFEENTYAIKTFIRPFKTLSFFVTVDHLSKVLPQYVFKKTQISVSDALSISLNDIGTNDPFFTKHLTTNEFFDLCRGQCSFKPVDNILKTRIFEDETNLTLEDELMIKLKNEIYPKKKSDSSQEDISYTGLRGIDPSLLSV